MTQGVLVEVDLAIDAAAQRDTLDPSRGRATTLVTLDGILAPGNSGGARRAAFQDGLARLGRATLRNFPGNLYWDFDILASVLAAIESPPAIERTADQVVALLDGFGCNSVINFRYIHDFTYGYDWARWVAKESAARSQIGPFSSDFLTYLDRRRGELLVLIARNDEKYGHLRPGEARNPFRFGREPEQERQLLEALAADDLIPVQAWTINGRATWDRSFSELREEYASRLGIPTRGK